MNRRFLFLLCVAFVFSASSGNAALPPGSVEAKKKSASEVLVIEVITVEEGTRKGVNVPVFLTSKVVSVEKSKTGLKPGKVIRIESFRRAKLSLPVAGPVAPSSTPKGWKGRVYLAKRESADKPFPLAVYGHSFEEIE